MVNMVGSMEFRVGTVPPPPIRNSIGGYIVALESIRFRSYGAIAR